MHFVLSEIQIEANRANRCIRWLIVLADISSSHYIKKEETRNILQRCYVLMLHSLPTRGRSVTSCWQHTFGMAQTQKPADLCTVSHSVNK